MRKRDDAYQKRKGMNMFIIIAFIVFGIYFINFPLTFYEVPEYISQYNDWIIFAGGILILFGAINYFKASN